MIIDFKSLSMKHKQHHFLDLWGTKQTGWFEKVLFLFFCGAVFSQIPFHEPWEDEIQAWLIARDCSILQIFHMMRYEGHFALWHLLLHPFARIGLPLITMNIISSLLIVCAGWFILFRSPFVRIVKAMLLASASFLYWYPVVARVYSLVPLLLFMLAASYAERKTHHFPRHTRS